MIKYVLALLGLAIIAGLTAIIDVRSRPQTVKSPSAEASLLIYAPGRVEGANECSELRPSRSGRVVTLLVEEGQEVAVGDVLLRLEDQELQSQCALAAAEVAVAKSEQLRLRNGARQSEKDEVRSLLEAKRAQLERAELTWQRTKALRSNNASSAQDADQQRTEVGVLKAEVAAALARYDLVHAGPRDEDFLIADARLQSALANLGLAQARLDYTQLRALVAGRVMRINVQPGEMVGPETTEPAIVMCDTSRLRVRAFVEEFEALRVPLGASATLTAEGASNLKIHGVVSRLAPQMTSKQLWSDSAVERLDSKVREVWIDLEYTGNQLVPGLPVEVTVNLSPKADQVAESDSGTVVVSAPMASHTRESP